MMFIFKAKTDDEIDIKNQGYMKNPHQTEKGVTKDLTEEGF